MKQDRKPAQLPDDTLNEYTGRRGVWRFRCGATKTTIDVVAVSWFAARQEAARVIGCEVGQCEVIHHAQQ